MPEKLVSSQPGKRRSSRLTLIEAMIVSEEEGQ